jgi:hypothetical protein
MATWTQAQLDEVDTVDEVELASRRPDGGLRAPTTIWMVRVGEDVFVRAAYGAGTRWNVRAREAGAGHVTAGFGIDHDVTFEPADPALAQAVTEAYDAKYDPKYERRIIDPVVSTEAVGTTLRVVPAGDA